MSKHVRRSPLLVSCLAASLGSALVTELAAAEPPPYTLFESGHVRPLAMSPNGKLLYAVNTPDNRLEIFRATEFGLQHRASVPVGLEPVAVAARGDEEVWVVNHVSDSVSVIDVTNPRRAFVKRTLLVGDEPRDIVFAGPGGARAFITTAHRGQNSPIDPQLTTEGVGRADVWVFDAGALGNTSLGGTPITIITLFSDTPRALAVSPDGTKVYAAGFHSGNRTSVIAEFLVPDGGEAAGGVPGPNVNFQNIPQPEVGLLVQHDGSHWRDIRNRIWDDQVKLSLPDKDVFVIDATASPPAQLPGPSGFVTGVGTILFNMAVNPASGKIYVSNIESFNMRRFEGPGIFAGETLRGRFHEDRITVLGPGGPAPRHLNKHIDFNTCCAPVPNAESEKSLALPQGMAVTSDGETLYVAAMGSDKIGVFDVAELESDTFTPSADDQIEVSGGGPTGIVIDEARGRLYVMTRFDNGISIIHNASQSEVGHILLHNPEPAEVVNGRRFLYDARFTSSHGDSACASCHIFGDFDSLAWDLGNPDATEVTNPGPIVFLVPVPPDIDFPAMKGPMTTQSLRGLANHGPMHWRGDRTGGNDAPSAQPDSGTFDEDAAFKQFQVGFTDLLGRSGPIPGDDMQAFTDFILRVTYPPNPIRNLDNSLTPDQQAGLAFFDGPISDGLVECEGCHRIDRGANPGALVPGFFGSDGTNAFIAETQPFKIPHFRNMYQKVGMFGHAPDFVVIPGNNDHLGDQVRGFGFLHDGSFDTTFRFVSIVGFGFPPGPAGDVVRRQVEDFILAFDSNMFPIVGQQVTLSHANAAAAGPRIDLLIARADQGECDLVAKGRFLHAELGFLYIGADTFAADREAVPPIPDAALRLLSLLFGVELTYTCTPPGSGERIGIDRDLDGYLDGDEDDAGSDPADPDSTP